MVHGGEGSMVLISDDEGRERGRGPLKFSDDGGRESERERESEESLSSLCSERGVFYDLCRKVVPSPPLL
jgi:hypothetical protein